MRSFNKKEIKNILAKAAELEMSHALDDETENLTEQEILAIAKEAGISTSSIKTALQSNNVPDFDKSFNWLSGTTRIQHLEEFGIHLQSEHIAKVLRMLQSNESELGEAELHPKKLTWNLQREIESTKVSLYEENGKTSFEYSSDWTELKFILATFPFLIMFIVTLIATKGMGFDKFTSLLIAPFGGFIALIGSWIYLKQKFEKQKKNLQATLEQLRNLFVHQDSKNEFIRVENEQNEDVQIRANKTKTGL